MRVLLWHVHGSWTTAFVQGPHRYLVPVVPGRGPDGRGRAATFDWPASVEEVTPGQLADAEIDVVVVQRPHELHELVPRWTGRQPGRDLPTVYLEHNTPPGVHQADHPARDRPDLAVVHVTHFNALLWDVGTTPWRVIEHGIVDPGHRYRGDRDAAAVVVNEPLRRGRATGTDLLAGFSRHIPLDLFGMGTAAATALAPDRMAAFDDVRQGELHDQMARRRLYLHPIRWTSLGLSLVEAMHLGMPVVALATTEVAEAVPAAAGVVSNRPDRLAEGIRRFRADPAAAAEAGRAAREAALARYGLDRFLHRWDEALQEVVP